MASTSKPVVKVILCGEYGVGKSSLFRRYVHNEFTESNDRRSTLGFDHYEKSFTVEGRQIIVRNDIAVFLAILLKFEAIVLDYAR